MTDFNSKFDIKPYTPIAKFTTRNIPGLRVHIENAAKVTGLNQIFIKKVVGNVEYLDSEQITLLLEQDAYSETFIPRSKILDYLEKESEKESTQTEEQIVEGLFQGDALDLIRNIPDNYVQTVVTSTPYWAMRIYDSMIPTNWADGEICPLGMEQTPEGFIRHSTQILSELYPKLSENGSIWWNIMDTFNTRTQIRGNAAEALRAMQGHDERSWSDHTHKRYSAGHSYLKDGEQCLIPQKIAERASRIGYYVKSIICWAKSSSLPEPQNSRVSRNIEFIVHLTKTRTPYFDKEQYRILEPKLGGRQPLESDKLSDFWYLPTSAGREGHGAQFPLELPARCIALSSKEGDVVLDPFIGSGTTSLAAALLSRKCIGFDISERYIELANSRTFTHQNSLIVRDDTLV
ncbi:DNA-methyltransferase [Brevibacillus parabrevis]|uniref:DNA-methyltransferase n=1 Tax=Brevibacillus parabrevis TaxID=54914 RepID=UPI0023800A8F|nr:site-specific DNA-methyltransferase [Brevibacillus parabrevis]WDV94872.1 site-specific DNA-methyltransferase [Brevibacillus parabrevis]